MLPSPHAWRRTPAHAWRNRSVLALIVTLLLASFGFVALPTHAAPGNLALGRPVTVSSSENAVAFPAAAVADGNTGTRWSSAFSDPQWVQIDLGASTSIGRVVLSWEAAYGRAYQLQTSNDAATWATVYSTTTGDGGTDDLTVSGSGRYIRLYGTARSGPYGYSLWEFEVYASGGSSTPTATPARTSTPAPTRTATPPPTTNLALSKPATASSSESAGTAANLAVDGNTGTRWSSAFSDPQWLQIDLGAPATISRVVLSWEAAYGKAYQIQTSNDAATWSTVYSTAAGDGGADDLTVSGSGRYVRLYGTARSGPYGYSLWEFAVYGTGGATPTPTPPVSDAFWGDTSTIPAAKNVLTFKFLNRTNGRYPDSQVYWSFNGETHSIAEQPYFDMPANSAGRMYFYLGSPSSPYYDFIEFTIGPTVFNGNTTRVDAFGLKLAMRLHCKDGYDAAVGENQATFQEDRAVTFQRFVNAMPAEFKHLGQIQAPYRIVEPGAGEFKPGGLYASYYDSFVNTLWANNGLTVPKPGPNGEGLAAYPDLSAAIFRHVGSAPGTFAPDGRLLNQSIWASSGTFYQTAPANSYAKFWHDNAIDGKAYGFPYDDVGGYSTFISHCSPQYLLVAIGW